MHLGNPPNVYCGLRPVLFQLPMSSENVDPRNLDQGFVRNSVRDAICPKTLVYFSKDGTSVLNDIIFCLVGLIKVKHAWFVRVDDDEL